MSDSSHSAPDRPRRAGAWLILVAVLACAGCAGSNKQVVSRQMLLPFNDEQREALARTEAAPYLLQRGDVFAVESLADEELRQPGVLVLPDGTASLTHIGNMRVAGLSIGEVEGQINAAYSRQFRDVHLNVVLREVSGRKVYVLGEVKLPGLHDIGREGVGIMGAIAMAGGLTDWASQGSIVVLRLTPEGYFSREFDISSLRKGRAFDAAALDLQPYDIVYVNRSKIGDFAAFTRDVVGSLAQYSRLILDMRVIENPELYRR